MGLLDRFFKKQQQQQLDALSAKGKGDAASKKESKTSANEVTKAKAEPAKEQKKPLRSVSTKGDKEQKKEQKSEQHHGKHPGMAYRAIVRPLITEKATDVGAFNQYIFEVRTDVNKHQIRQAIRELYNVVPTHIRVLNVRGSAVRFGRNYGSTKGWRKAIVRLPEGKTIQVSEA